MSDLFDICVVGGGPAGSSLALRLAQLARTVVLVEKASFPRLHIGESLTGGILPLLGVLGVRADVESAGFLAAPRATVLWAGQLRHRETHGGYQVDRGPFDALLLQAACRAGVIVRQPAAVRSCSFDRIWTATLDTGETLQARFLADCAGRSGILPSRKTPTGARALAFYAYWSKVDPDQGDTIVEAASSHWYWGAPLPGGLFNATVFVDPSGATLADYPGLIRESKLLSRRLADRSYDEIHACTATSFLEEFLVAENFIKAGDAALAIDPLSSQGVQTAIGTALHAAVVANTIIERPENTPLALDFYRRRLCDSATFHTRSSQLLCQEQLEVTDTPFWRKRAADHPVPKQQPRDLAPDRPVRLVPQLSFVPVPTVSDRHIIQTNGVECNGQRIAFVGGHCLSDFLQQIDAPLTARECVRRWSQNIPCEEALQLFQWAWNHGLLEQLP